MMPSRVRLASGAAAGVVGLAVAGLILFGTEPLGMGSTVIAVPASPSAVAGSSAETEADAPDTEGASEDRTAARTNRRPWPRPEPTGTTKGVPRPTYKPGDWANTSRPPTRYGYPRPSWRPPTTTTSRRPTVKPRPTATRSSAAPTRKPSPRPTATASRSSASPTPTPTPTTASPSSASPTPSDRYAVRSAWAAAVLDRLNDQRAKHGLPALTSNAKLAAAAHAHNVRMADANQLSHQLPGEPGLGDRVTAAGYSWRALGENVAWNSSRTEAGVLALQDAMYNETPPNDGHRKNILSSNFTEVGIDVIEDPEHGKVWLVTDFGRP